MHSPLLTSARYSQVPTVEGTSEYVDVVFEIFDQLPLFNRFSQF